MPDAKIEIYPTLEDVAQAAAAECIAIARRAIADKGRFTMALSGGESPKPFHRILAVSEGIDWEKTHIFWGDERCVPPDDPASNYGMAHETLLKDIPIPEANIHRMAGEMQPQAAAVAYQQVLTRYWDGELPRFDVMIQGLGANAHTASLFPHTPALHITDQWVVAPYIDEISASRITLTAPVINNARNVIFLVTGESKAPAILQVIRGERDVDQYPAQLITPTAGELLWLLDSGAARLL